MNTSPETPATPPPNSLPPDQTPPWLRTVFEGPGGIRAGWRLLLAFGIFLAFSFLIGGAMRLIPGLIPLIRSAQTGTLNSPGMIIGEGSAVVMLILTALVMTVIEGRTFTAYGLPGRQVFGRLFWQGAGWGLGMVTLMMGLIATFHGFSLGTLDMTGLSVLKYGVLWAITFLIVGIFEEFSFRGYLQATLGSGIGFWPAAIVLSMIFGGIHLGNKGEAWVGALGAGSIGLLFAFTLRRTGSIWFAIGAHMAFDWGETFFYSVPDSGLLAKGKLLNSTLHGPRWLAGGTIGPEGSVMCFLTLLITAILFNHFYPARKPS